MMKLVIFGTGSLGELARFYFDRDSDYTVVAFTASGKSISDSAFEGLPVVPFEEVQDIYPPDEHSMFVGIGYRQVNKLRAQFYEEAKHKSYRLATYVSSKCTHWGENPIGDNCFIFEGNNIQPKVEIGNNVILWSGNHIGHHSTIGNHVFITSHVVVSGHTRVGDYSFLGVNATLRDDITIGESCVIGAGAVIMKSTANREVYITRRTKPDDRASDEIGL